MPQRPTPTDLTLRPLPLALLSVMLAMPLVASLPAHAAEPTPATTEQQQPYRIPAGTLEAALNALGRQAGIVLMFSSDLVGGKNSGGLSGHFTPGQALERLLGDTGLVATPQSGGGYSIASEQQGATTLPPVRVIGNAVRPDGLPSEYAGGQVARGGSLGILGNQDIMDTPFNQTSYTSELIQNQQAKTANDVLLNDPSVNLQSSRSGGFEQVSIRGFGGLGQDRFSVNGIWGTTSIVPLEMVERVEVLKGPTAFLNGMPPSNNAIGGTVNFVTKRAKDKPLTQLTTSYESRSNFGAHFDVGRRFGDNKEFGARFNASYKDGETAVKQNEQELGLLSLGLDHRSERVRFSADFSYKDINIDGSTPFIFLDAGVSIPDAPDASKSFVPPWNNRYTEELAGMVQGEVDITDKVTAYAAFSARDWSVGGYSAIPFISNPNGDFTGAPADWGEEYINLAGQAGIRASIDTGAVQHDLVLDGSWASRDYSYGSISGPAYSSNIYNPSAVPDPNIPDSDPYKRAESTFTSIGLSDTLSTLDERIQFTAGIRRQQPERDNFDAAGAVTSSYDDSAWTPFYGLVFKPLENVSVYANYIQGLESGSIVSTDYKNAGDQFPPHETEQYEVGVKVDWDTLTTTVSAFDITRPSTISIPGAPLPVLALDGEQVNRGMEVNVFGEPINGVRFLGGVMLLNGELKKTENGTNDGNIAPGVPDITVSLGGEWDTPFLSGLTLSGRVNRTSKTYIDAENTRSVTAWTRLDLGARYRIDKVWWNGKPLTLRFDIQNVTDENYWMVNGTALALGAPRTFLLSATFDF